MIYLNLLLVFICIVFIHEFGHYLFARIFKAEVTDFSIGFGKEIFGWNDKSGTRWKICWIPLGGYVKFFGDRNVFSQSEQQELINKAKIFKDELYKEWKDKSDLQIINAESKHAPKWVRGLSHGERKK